VLEYVLSVAGKVVTPAARNYSGFAEPTAVESFCPSHRSTDRLYRRSADRHPRIRQL